MLPPIPRCNNTCKRWLSLLVSRLQFIILVVVQLSPVLGFYLQGSRTSYVRLPRWHSCSNSSLTLGFWTSLPDALLVYADDGGLSSFLMLSVENGTVVVRISVPVDEQTAAGEDHDITTLRAGSRPVNDRHWHTVSVSPSRGPPIPPIPSAHTVL